MTRPYRSALLGVALVVALVGACAAWTDLRSPQSAAEENSYPVWIALLKGLSGDVVYVGSDETHAYFRLGAVFWSYYKLPVCAAQLPEVFSVGNGSPYVVKLHAEEGYIRTVNRCAHVDGYALGELDRK